MACCSPTSRTSPGRWSAGRTGARRGARARRCMRNWVELPLKRISNSLPASICPRGDLLPLRQVRVRARPEADARSAHEGGGVLPRGVAFARPPGERVSIPFEGKTICGVLRKPHSQNPRADHGARAWTRPRRRSMPTRSRSCARHRGAGDRRAGAGRGGVRDSDLRRLRARRESGGGLDREAKRPEFGKQVGIWGVSLGGYYAPRAAAYEKRIRACIALSGPVRMGPRSGTACRS